MVECCGIFNLNISCIESILVALKTLYNRGCIGDFKAHELGKSSRNTDSLRYHARSRKSNQHICTDDIHNNI